MKTLLFILAVVLCSYQGIAQLSQTSLPITKSIYTIKGDYYRQYRNYTLAINTYSKAVRLNQKEVSAMLGMADAYHLMGQNSLASQWYRKAFAIYPDVGTEHILKFIAVLNATGNSAELRQWVKLYNNKIAKSGDPIDSIIFVVENLTSLNSKSSDSAPLFYDNKIVFSSNRTIAGNFSAYKSTLNSEGIFGEVSPLHEAINSGRTEGSFALAANKGILYFTGTEEKGGATAMKIFSTALPNVSSGQLKVNKLAFKNFEHSMGQPAISSDGTVLYFAAQHSKHTRGFDLYHSQYNGKNWSAPVSLGTHVNSNADELYPVLANDSTLYFASNGHSSFGGFDIFKVNLRHVPLHSPEHLPLPINSSADEFGFSMNSTGDEAYLSSNRPGGLGANDIYRIYFLSSRKKKRDATPQHEELFIHTSKEKEIKLSGDSHDNLKFDFYPGQNFNLVVEYDNFLKGTTQTINAAMLTKMNVYTFDIQKSSEVAHDQKNKIKPVKDIHINPGDLVTFQLIPIRRQDSDAETSKVQFQKSEASVGDDQTIVFSYIAKGGIGLTDDMRQVADLREKLDTVSSPQLLTVKAPVTESNQAPQETKTQVSLVQNNVKQVTPVVPVKSPVIESNLTPSETKPQVSLVQSDEKQVTPVVPTVKSPVTESNLTPSEPKPQVSLVQSDEKQVTPVVPVKSPVIESNLTPSETKPQVSLVQNDVKQITPVVPVKSPVIESNLTPSETKPQVSLVQNDVKQITPVVPVKSPVTESNLTPSETKPQVSLVQNDVKQITPVVPVKSPVIESNLTPSEAKPQVSLVQSDVKQITPVVPVDANPVIKTMDIQYRVQIAASKTKMSDDQLKKIYSGLGEIRSFNEDGYFKYYILQTPSYPTAKNALNTSGVGTAFIVAYLGEKKLKLPEAIALQKSRNNLTSSPAVSVNAPVVNEDLKNDPVNAGGNEKQIVATPSNKVLSTDSLKQSTLTKNKLPISNVETDKPAGIVNTQPGNFSGGRDFLYRVQIAASEVTLNDAQLKKIYRGSNEIHFIKEGKFYKYYILETPSYFVARQKLKEINVNQAFISAYKKDLKVSLEEAINSQYKLPAKKENLAEIDSVVKVVTLNFEFDAFELPPDQLERLRNKVISELVKNSSYRAIVNGYTDDRVNEKYNFGLSQERALFVAQHIVGDGIDAGRVATRYFGESQFARYCRDNKNCDESVHQTNRHVEILLVIDKK
ncbi:hypothetical protein WSM22_39330 [Cytophagales bacterium WSM2-2]|nr:hypothetical protein WSM22_39330 [Cytophagales bacterium WSM2-2]